MSKPNMPETDYRQMWKNYSGYMADAQARFQKSSGIARAKMAQSGITEGTSAWATRMKVIEDQYKTDVQEIRRGATGLALAEEFKNRYRDLQGADFGLAKAMKGMSKNERADYIRVTEEMMGPKSEENIFDGTYGQHNQWQRTKAAMHAPEVFFDIYERERSGEKVNFKDPELLAQYYGNMFKSNKGQMAKEAKANEALERAKTAASGGTAGQAMTAQAAQEEQKKTIVNPWL